MFQYMNMLLYVQVPHSRHWFCSLVEYLYGRRSPLNDPSSKAAYKDCSRPKRNVILIVLIVFVLPLHMQFRKLIIIIIIHCSILFFQMKLDKLCTRVARHHQILSSSPAAVNPATSTSMTPSGSQNESQGSSCNSAPQEVKRIHFIKITINYHIYNKFKIAEY